MNPQDGQALAALRKEVDEKIDLSSKEKEFDFALGVSLYALDNAAKVAKSPDGITQSERLGGLNQTYQAAKDLHNLLSPHIVAPEGVKTGTAVPPSFDLGTPGSLASNSASDPVAAPNNNSAAPPPPGNDGTQPPIEPVKPDPGELALKLYQSRQEEAQDAFKDWKNVMQKMSDWKQRIAASRMAFFWRIYNMHADFISGKNK